MPVKVAVPVQVPEVPLLVPGAVQVPVLVPVQVQEVPILVPGPVQEL